MALLATVIIVVGLQTATTNENSLPEGFPANARFHNPEVGQGHVTNNTLYYNDKGADFVPWVTRLITQVKRHWLVPQNAAWDHGHVVVKLSVDRRDKLTATEVLVSSEIGSFDEAAIYAVKKARFSRLPAHYPHDSFEIVVVFWYNEVPYDLFH